MSCKYEDISKSRFSIQSGSRPGAAESDGSTTLFGVQTFKNEGKLKAHESYGHQYFYSAKVTQEINFYLIIKIVSESMFPKFHLGQS